VKRTRNCGPTSSGVFFVPAASTKRADGGRPIDDRVPKGKQVVLWLVTFGRPNLENKDDLKRRIEEASRLVDGDDLAISPQCGFASIVEGNLITLDDEIAKLRLVVETAREVWGRA